MRLVIFGANGPTGRLLTAQALTAGHTVTAFTLDGTQLWQWTNDDTILSGAVIGRAHV